MMKIYVGHSNSFDFNSNIYKPIRRSELNKEHFFVLPHEDSMEPFDTKGFLPECDLFIAEVSYKSTGLGIELGWADILGVPIVCFYKEGDRPSSSVYKVAEKVIEYKSEHDFIIKLAHLLS